MFVTSATGAVGTVKLEVYTAVPFTTLKFEIKPSTPHQLPDASPEVPAAYLVPIVAVALLEKFVVFVLEPFSTPLINVLSVELSLAIAIWFQAFNVIPATAFPLTGTKTPSPHPLHLVLLMMRQ